MRATEVTGERPVRLFVALELPAVVRETLLAWRAPLLSSEPALRGVSREGLHLTLCFLGSSPAGAVERIAEACDAVRDLPARELRTGQMLWLPSSRRPRVLAIAVEDPCGELASLQERLTQALVATGHFEPEQRAFLGHVTLARLRGERRVPGAVIEPPPGETFDGERVTLFRSHLGGGGARYEALHTVRLTGL